MQSPVAGFVGEREPISPEFPWLDNRFEPLAVLRQEQLGLLLDIFFRQKRDAAARSQVSSNHCYLPSSFNLRACSVNVRSCSGVKPLASRNSSGISVGCFRVSPNVITLLLGVGFGIVTVAPHCLHFPFRPAYSSFTEKRLPQL
jgi:hypothetical protein